MTSERSFFVANFGCRASQSEGGAIEEELLDASATRAESVYDARVVVVNTCTVTEEADREARQTIRRIASRNPEARIIVTGCYAQRAADELAVMPQVSHVVGNSHKPLVGRLALQVIEDSAEVSQRASGRAEIYCSDIFLEQELRPGSYQGSAGRTRAIVKVQDGCDANCSFCVIPSVRGRSRSLEPDAVIAEVAALVGRDYKEVVLSGIHLGSYGRDLERKTSLYALIHRILEEVPALERLRLSSIEPLEVTPEIIRLVAGEPRLAHHFHIPLQSGSRRVLRAMRRPYSPEYYRDLAAEARRQLPDAAIGADVMVGFPGETDAEFAETLGLIEESPLTYLHVFPYSSRPGTVAADMRPPVPSHVTQFRAKALRAAIARKNEAFRRSLVGNLAEVLVLQPGEALSSNFVRVCVPVELSVNHWTRVRVTGLDGDGLQGALSSTTTAQETN